MATFRVPLLGTNKEEERDDVAVSAERADEEVHDGQGGRPAAGEQQEEGDHRREDDQGDPWPRALGADRRDRHVDHRGGEADQADQGGLKAQDASSA